MKVAIVGNGNICKLAHIYAWQSMKEIDIRATCDITAERAERAYKESNAVKYYTRMEDLLSDDSIDIIDLCVPTHEHANLSIAALKAGKHVICEKPMARSLKDAESMLKAADKSSKGLYIAHTRRFDRRWRKIKDNIGRIGSPMYIRRCERSWLPFPADSWYWDSEKSGGVLLDLGVHCVDLVKWLFEFESKVNEVFAKGKRIRREAKANNTCDLATILLKIEGEKTAFVDVSWAFPGAYAPFYSSLDIVGTAGRIEYSDKNTNPIVFVRDKIEIPRYSPLLSTDLNAFREEMGEFVRCIEKGEEPIITKEDAYEILRVVLAAEESMERGKAVKL